MGWEASVGFQNQFHVPDTCTESSSSRVIPGNFEEPLSLSLLVTASSCLPESLQSEVTALCDLHVYCLPSLSYGPTSSRSHCGVHLLPPGEVRSRFRRVIYKALSCRCGQPCRGGQGRAAHSSDEPDMLSVPRGTPRCWGQESGEGQGFKRRAQEHIS